MKPRVLSILSFALLGGVVSAQNTLSVPGQYGTIKSAVSVAQNGDTVLVSAGTYNENNIYLNGKKITIRSVSGAASTFIDGQQSSRIFRFNGGEDLNTVLEGFTLVNGQAPTGGGTIGDGGGAILFQNSSPWIRSCVFEDCRADNGIVGGANQAGYRGGHGGAVYLINSDVRFDGCSFLGNDAGSGGDGGTGSSGVQGTFFYPTGTAGKNAGAGGRGGHGGAVFMDSASGPMFFNCYFLGNRSGDGGRGGAGGSGGPGYNDLLIGYTGKGGAGGRGGNGGSGGDGGTIYAENGSQPLIVNSTFAKNLNGNNLPVGPGGPGGTGTSSGSPGADGSPGSLGDGSSAYGFGGNVEVSNTISWDNEDSDFVNATVDFSLVDGGYAGIGNLNEDPLFQSTFSYVLTTNSPCIDAGDSNRVPAWAVGDIAGQPRRLDHPLVVDTGFGAAPMVDIGAFEFAGAFILPYGCGINPIGSLTVLAGQPKIGNTVTFGIDNPLGTQSAGAIPALLYSLTPPLGPCGVMLANFGMAGNGAPGAFLIGVDLDGILGSPWAGTGNPAAIAAPLPNDTSLIGVSLYTQGALVGGGGVGLTDAIELVVGP